MMGKGATYKEAKRLKELKQSKNEKSNIVYNISNNDEHGYPNRNNGDVDNDDDDDNDEDNFLRRYRNRRLNELKNEKYGTVIPIQRNEWNHQVNEASQDGTWVIINLTAQKSSPNDHPMHKEICVLIENDIIPLLAMKYQAVKFVSIPSTSAIENWPENNLPTLFCYRYGKLQHQLVGLGEFGVQSKSDGMNCDKVEYRLGQLGIIDTDIVEDDMNFDDDRRSQNQVSSAASKRNSTSTTTNPGGQRYGRSHFGGVMSQLQTGLDNGDESDYDDVD